LVAGRFLRVVVGCRLDAGDGGCSGARIRRESDGRGSGDDQDVSSKYEFIDAEYAAGTAADTADAPIITQMCGWLEVSRSGFYDWKSRPESATSARRNELKLVISKAFEDSDGTEIPEVARRLVGAAHRQPPDL
jgi:hypothetical protein